MAYQIRYPRARLSPAKQGLVVVEFARRHIESGDIAEILKALAPMAATRENAELFEGRVAFWFSGWDDDPRELAECGAIDQMPPEIAQDTRREFWLGWGRLTKRKKSYAKAFMPLLGGVSMGERTLACQIEAHSNLAPDRPRQRVRLGPVFAFLDGHLNKP